MLTFCSCFSAARGSRAPSCAWSRDEVSRITDAKVFYCAVCISFTGLCFCVNSNLDLHIRSMAVVRMQPRCSLTCRHHSAGPTKTSRLSQRPFCREFDVYSRLPLCYLGCAWDASMAAFPFCDAHAIFISSRSDGTSPKAHSDVPSSWAGPWWVVVHGVSPGIFPSRCVVRYEHRFSC